MQVIEGKKKLIEGKKKLKNTQNKKVISELLEDPIQEPVLTIYAIKKLADDAVNDAEIALHDEEANDEYNELKQADIAKTQQNINELKELKSIDNTEPWVDALSKLLMKHGKISTYIATHSPKQIVNQKKVYPELPKSARTIFYDTILKQINDGIETGRGIRKSDIITKGEFGAKLYRVAKYLYDLTPIDTPVIGSKTTYKDATALQNKIKNVKQFTQAAYDELINLPTGKGAKRTRQKLVDAFVKLELPVLKGSGRNGRATAEEYQAALKLAFPKFKK